MSKVKYYDFEVIKMSKKYCKRCWVFVLIILLLFVISLRKISAQPGDSEEKVHISPESEPNDEILNANTIQLDIVIQGEIKNDSDKDFYCFTSLSNCRDIIQIKIKDSAETLAPSLRVYDKEKSEITSGFYGVYTKTKGANLTHSFSAEAGSIYYVAIAPHYQKGKGSYKLIVKSLHAYDEYEPNDTVDHAKSVSFGEAIEAGIMDEKDRDFFKVKAVAKNGEATIRIENQSTTLAPRLRIYNSEKEEITKGYYGIYAKTAGSNLNHSFAIKSDSIYYFEVKSHYQKGYGNYKLTVNVK